MRVPHIRVVIGVTIAAIAGFAAVSAHVLHFSDDEVTKGAIIGTWQNVALLAFGFWLGSSSAGKARHDEPASIPETTVTVEQAP